MRQILALGFLFELAAVVPASADVITFIYTHSVTDVQAVSSPIYAFGNVAFGQQATLVFTDDTLKDTVANDGGDLVNGTAVSSNPVSFLLTVNGPSYSGTGLIPTFDDAEVNPIFVDQAWFSGQTLAGVVGAAAEQSSITANISAGSFYDTLAHNFDFMGQQGDFAFSEGTCAGVSSGNCSTINDVGPLTLNFTATSVVAAVHRNISIPELLTLSLVGAGLAGATALRRRKNTRKL